MNLHEWREAKRAFKQQLDTNARPMLSIVFRDFFRKFPKVEALKWTQYTPHYGSEQFQLHPIHVKGDIKQYLVTKAEPEDEDEFYWPSNLIPQCPLDREILALEKSFQDVVEVFEVAFGDGVTVVVSRDGFEVIDADF